MRIKTMVSCVKDLFSCGSKDRKGSTMVQEKDEGWSCLSCGGDKCPAGFTVHAWRKSCSGCRCRRERHDLSQEEALLIVNQWIGSSDDPTQLIHRRKKSLKIGYSWIPPGLTKEKVEEYVQQLDISKISKIGSEGERNRIVQLLLQLPKHDLSSQFCRHLKTTNEKKDFDEFVKVRQTEVMETATVAECTDENLVCRKCEAEMEKGKLAVKAAGENLLVWHPSCFVCVVCQEPPVDLIHCHKDGSIYCQRHYAQSIRPRCSGCEELIFSTKYFKAMNKDFHEDHFACFECDASLTGQRYIKHDEEPFCVNCYEKLFAHVCEECKEVIGHGSKDLSYKELHWHDRCFKCSECQSSLVGEQFASNNEKLFCAGCHDNKFAARCDVCGEIFRAGMKKYEYDGKKYHEACFCCDTCHQPITNNSFIPRDGKIFCTGCFEKQFGKRCTKCNQVIIKDGVTYKELPWHRDCFTCAQCSKTLAGEKFTTKEDKPYCVDCYGQLFAKKCCQCTKAITGLGQTKLITFEDRHWHPDCFQCQRCKTSLVGQGFILDGPSAIFCPDCSTAESEETQ